MAGWNSTRWHMRSIRDRARRLAGEHLRKRSTTCSGRIPLSIRYSERLAEAGIEPSVGSVGDSYDNALAETIKGLFKAEVIHRRGPWRSFEAVEYATLEWVDGFNNRRLLEPIGNIPPADEAEANLYAALETEAMAA
jgi:putative transposase